jgi:hypothetical protein
MSTPTTDWRTWLLFVFTNNDDVDRSMTDEELKHAVCREPDTLAVALLRLAEAQHHNAELLAALKRLVREIRTYHPTFDARLYVEAERLVAKAEGRS